MKVRKLRRLLTLAGLLLALAWAAFPQSLIIFPTPPPGPPVPLSDGIQGQSYFSGVSTNGSGPTTWSIIAGSLPTGVSVSPGSNFANFSGTPTAPGTFVFTVQAIDATGLKATQQYSINIIATLIINTPPTLHSATEGASYTVFLSAMNGTPPYTWSLGIVSLGGSIGKRSLRHAAMTTPTRGLVPAGLTLSGNGVLSGVPSQAGVFTFDVSVVDSATFLQQVATQTFTLVVNVPPSITSSTTLPVGVVGVRYSTPLRAQGGTIPYLWTVTGGTFPPGLTLASDGSLTGTPTQAGTYNFTGVVTDLYGAKASGVFTLNVSAGLAITTVSPLAVGAVGTPYSVPFTAVAGIKPYVWSVASGVLPAGLTLDPASGVLSGTPTAAGKFQFSIQVADAAKNIATAGFSVTVTEALTITTSSLPDGTIGVAYSQKVTVTGGTSPYTFLITTGALPAGLSLDPASGAITGTPTRTGVSNLTVQVTDAAQITTSKKLSLNIASSLAFTTGSPLTNATGGAAYSQTINATGGTPPYTFTIDSGALPTGISLDPSGKLAGTPTGLGAFNFTVRVTDSSQATVTNAYDLTVSAPAVPPPTISGVGNTAPPAQQPTLSLELGQAYPLALSGTMILTFTSAVGNVDDPAIQFSTGGRTVSFTVAPGTTAAVFPNAQISMATGTVAGTITLTLHFAAGGEDVTPTPAPARVIQLPAQAPVITTVTAHHTTSGIEVDVTGLSNTRDMVSAAFQFQAAPGTTLQNAQATITADQLFATWFNDGGSDAFGSQFTYTQPFTISGNLNGVTGVSVTLTNKQGASSSASGTVQ